MNTTKNLSTLQKLTVSGVVIGLYITIMMFTQGFAFGQFQIRIATALYSLAALHPFLIVPLGISNFLSNTLMGGLGLLDMIGGVVVGIATSSLVYLIRKHRLNDWFIALPIILCPGLMVPLWLSYLLHIPYPVLAFSLIIGQIIPGIAGVLLLKKLQYRFSKLPMANSKGIDNGE